MPTFAILGHTTTSERKKDHIELAFQSIVQQQDDRFYYEPMLSAHPEGGPKAVKFAGKDLKAPLWVSSMTGGTKEAGTINRNLAKAVGEFGLGMGLGSCRIILEDDTYLSDFQLRDLVGNQPLYCNLGIAQLEELLDAGRMHLVKELVKKTETDGLIIHVNPLQEWLQPEGDLFGKAPIDTIKRVLDEDIPIMVKEVGQGFGPESMKALMQLPLVAIDFGAHGGTNFSKLELHRGPQVEHEVYDKIGSWGHSAHEMVGIYNCLNEELDSLNRDADVIISGGVKDFTDGYFLTSSIEANAIYGQASAFLRHARGSYQELKEYVELQMKGLALAEQYLRVKPKQ